MTGTTNPLLAVIPYHLGDLEAAQRLLTWIKELGGCPTHHCLLIADAAVPKDERAKVKEQAAKEFASVQALSAQMPTAATGGDSQMADKHALANKMFATSASVVLSQYRIPFMWLEPDCVPLVRDWMDKLSDEYYRQARPYVGAIITTDKRINREDMPDRFLAGCAVYPQNAFDAISKHCRGALAWDLASATEIVPMACNTPLIQHYWGRPEVPPTFKPDDVIIDGTKNEFHLDFIAKEAVLFHRVKDASLINLFRKQAIDNGYLPGTMRKAEKGRVRTKPEEPAPVVPAKMDV